jgi:hypothetical protein
MAPTQSFIQLKTFLENMELVKKIGVRVFEREDMETACLIWRTQNNKWQTHDGRGEQSLDVFLENFFSDGPVIRLEFYERE